MKIRQIAQAMVDEVSWKCYRVFVDEDAKEQIIQYPSTMLQSDEICGGCVDKVVLLCTLLRALGFRSRFKSAETKENKGWWHVWVEVNLPTEKGGEWVAIDPSKESFKIGDKKTWEKYWNDNFISRGFPPSENALIYEIN